MPEITYIYSQNSAINFLRIIKNYKSLFVKLYNIFHSKYLKLKNYNNKKNCLSFFEDNLLEKIILLVFNFILKKVNTMEKNY